MSKILIYPWTSPPHRAWTWTSRFVVVSTSIPEHLFSLGFQTLQLSHTWTSGPQMINTRSVHGCARFESGLVVAAGGDGKSSVELLIPGTNAWTQGLD